MQTLLISGTHPRHRFLVETCVDLNHGEVDLLVYQREELEPTPKDSLPKDLEALWYHHFERRKQVEQAHFGLGTITSPDSLRRFRKHYFTVADEFNKTLKKILGGYDRVLIFGSGMIQEDLLADLPNETFNLHLGLSPWYRGSATLFWPSYNMEPEKLGLTLHRIAAKPDAGPLVHQTSLEIPKNCGWDIQEAAVASVVQGVSAIRKVLERVAETRQWVEKNQPIVGKTFLKRDFRAHHLIPVYETFGGRVISALQAKGVEMIPPPIFTKNLDQS